MPQVKLTLSSYADITFRAEKVVTFDNDDWDDMTIEERQGLINEEGEQFLRDMVEWDYKVL